MAACCKQDTVEKLLDLSVRIPTSGPQAGDYQGLVQQREPRRDSKKTEEKNLTRHGGHSRI